MFTVGGTISSLTCDAVARRTHAGRRETLTAAALFSLAGACLLLVASSPLALGTARLLQGFAAGIGIAQVPVFLRELAPPAVSGSIGVLNQVAIVSGIFAAQCLGTLGPRGAWRHVPFSSSAVAAVQLLGARLVSVPSSDAERDALWQGYAAVPPAPDDEAQPARQAAAPSYRKGLSIILLTQVAQQLSGVNAILYYSTGILATLMPGAARYIGLLITVVNGVMTFPPLVLIDERRAGRKALLVGSAAGMGMCCLVLAYSLATSAVVLSACAITATIACFSIGFGPVPFVIMPEVVPPESAAHAASLGLAANWISNAAVALAFQPVRTALAPLDGGTGGMVFVLFGVINLASAALIAQRYTYIGTI